MNTNILTKCLTELEKVTPDVSYLRGMIETLISISGAPVATPVMNTSYIHQKQDMGNPADWNNKDFVKNTTIRSDEQEEIPAAARSGPLGRLNS
jgi:hypothetical protein